MTIWMTARGAGLAALVLLTLSTCLGALATRRAGQTPANRVVRQYLHRTAGSLGIGVLTLHIVTIVADSYAHVGVTGAVVPFTSGYRATWVGLATIAMYCLLLVAGLGFARGRMATSATGARLWRVTHLLAYGAWALALVHGFMAGTDSGVLWVRGLYVMCLVSVAGAVWVRLNGLAHSSDTTPPIGRPAHAATPTAPLTAKAMAR
jgi:sulfoxide reductase heme-binding subunit YedZ